nr:hypothetical protein [Tanacetum cinerariifolium]
MVTKGVVLDDSLVSRESTYDNTTSSEQQDESSNLRYDVDAEIVLIDIDAFDIENDDIGPSYDTNTEVNQSNNDTFETLFAYDIQNVDPNRDKEEHDYIDEQQECTFFAFLVNNLKCEVENYTNVNHEAQQANALLT